MLNKDKYIKDLLHEHKLLRKMFAEEKEKNKSLKNIIENLHDDIRIYEEQYEVKY